MPVTILVADDSATMRKIFEMTFAAEEVHVVTVASGEDAAARAKGLRPDVVFADGSMPGMDGYELCRALKTTPDLAGVAVVLVGSQHHPYDAERGRACGVDDHVSKPFDTQALIDRVAHVLLRPRAVVAGTSTSTSGSGLSHGQMAPAALGPAGWRPGSRSTVAFGTPPVAPVGAEAARPAQRSAPPSPPSQRPEPISSARNVAAAGDASGGNGHPGGRADLQPRLAELGLSADQVTAVLALYREAVEQVVWEVVPDLAEMLIREEIERLTQ